MSVENISKRTGRKPADEAAASWLARRDAGWSEAEQQEFTGWLAADPRHAAAWQEVESAWLVLDRIRHAGRAEGMIRELEARRQRRRWKIRAGLATGLAAAAAITLVFFLRPGHHGEAGETGTRGVVVKPAHRVLEDGSVIESNRGAVVVVDYTPGQRNVRLVQGEALFTVAKNAARPFVVTSGKVQVRAVGTAFAVKLDGQAVDVLVTEGTVAVNRAENTQPQQRADAVAKQPVMVTAGDRLLVPPTTDNSRPLKVETLPREEIERRLAWRGPRLELSGTRLSDAIALLNRENRVQISIADPTLGQLRLSGVFRADNAEGFVRLLAASYGVQAVASGEHEIVLRQK